MGTGPVDLRNKLEKELETFGALVSKGEVKEADQLSPTLHTILQDMKEAGVPFFGWDALKPLVRHALSLSLDEFRAKHPDTDPLPMQSAAATPPLVGGAEEAATQEQLFVQHKQRLLEAVDHAQGAPFTLQRLCELILAPGESYSHVNKLLFGLEKLLSVSTFVDTAPPDAIMPSANQENKMQTDEGSKTNEAANVKGTQEAPKVDSGSKMDAQEI